MLSPRLKEELSQRSVAENFGAFEGETLRLPEDAALPDTEFIATHLATVFLKT